MIWLVRIIALIIFSICLLACSQNSQSSTADNGMITPTIYYIPIIKSSDQACALEGTCLIEEKGRLTKLKLADTSTHLPYTRISGPEADQVRASRHYPH